MEPIDLPENVHEACLRLLKEFGLNYGAIDLCLDENGEYIFFEINRAGQFLWMEKRIEGLELSKEIARLLIGESEPMIPPASKMEGVICWARCP
jgi:glutathione synthase/RimK-type ligase-like ATP-grasp enzyme